MFGVKIILVISTVDIVQCYCVLCGIYCGYSNSRYGVMLLFLLEFIVVTATEVVVQWYCVVLEFIVVKETVDIVQCYCVLCTDYCGYGNSRYSPMVLFTLEFIVVTATVDILQWFCVVLESIVVTATVVIVQWYCVVSGDYCG